MVVKKSKIINLYNDAHLGDAIFVMIYLYNCKDYIIKNNITVNFYMKEKYIKQVKEFKCCPNIHLHKIIINKNCIVPKILEHKFEAMYDTFSDIQTCDTNIPDGAINTTQVWNSPLEYFLKDLTIFKEGNNKYPFNKFLENILSRVGKKVGLPKLKKFEYKDPELLVRFDKLKNIYKEADILVINSIPRTMQFDMEKNKKAFDNCIHELSKKYNIVTTEKVGNLPCSRDDNLSVKDIAAISTHVKYIIAINTGPLIGCLNTYALKNVKKWFEFDINMPFIYKNFVVNPTFEEIINEIDG
jgi:hypothetical protein